MLSLILGPIITLIVGFLKRIPFVAHNPKLTATILAALATVLALVPGAHTAADLLKSIADNFLQLAASAAVSASVAVAGHEVAKPILRATGIDPTTSTTHPVSPLQGGSGR